MGVLMITRPRVFRVPKKRERSCHLVVKASGIKASVSRTLNRQNALNNCLPPSSPKFSLLSPEALVHPDSSPRQPLKVGEVAVK